MCLANLIKFFIHFDHQNMLYLSIIILSYLIKMLKKIDKNKTLLTLFIIFKD